MIFHQYLLSYYKDNLYIQKCILKETVHLNKNQHLLSFALISLQNQYDLFSSVKHKRRHFGKENPCKRCYVYVCMCVYVYVYMCMYTVYVCIYIYICVYIYVYIYIIYIYIVLEPTKITKKAFQNVLFCTLNNWPDHRGLSKICLIAFWLA